MKKDYQCNSINHEMFKIKKAYCKKCIYFDDDNFKCTQNKIYKKCFKNDERVINGCFLKVDIKQKPTREKE